MLIIIISKVIVLILLLVIITKILSVILNVILNLILNVKPIRRKSSKRYILETVIPCSIIYILLYIQPYLIEKGCIYNKDIIDSKIANYLTALIFMYNAFRYIKDTKEQHNMAAIPYRPFYLVEKMYLDRKLTKKDRGKKEVKIIVNFAEGDAIIRNVNVYKLNDKDELELITSHTKLNNNDKVYEGSLKSDLLVVVDTQNRERIFTIITERNIVSAIDQTYRLNFSINDLAYKTQDPMYESDKKILIQRLHNIIKNSTYYKKTR